MTWRFFLSTNTERENEPRNNKEMTAIILWDESDWFFHKKKFLRVHFVQKRGRKNGWERLVKKQERVQWKLGRRKKYPNARRIRSSWNIRTQISTCRVVTKRGRKEYTECQAFFPVVQTGFPNPSPTRECFSSPTLGPERGTHSLARGGGDPIQTQG
jgi:hypothetical protein